jgi:transcription termination/antitermination protein NusA
MHGVETAMLSAARKVIGRDIRIEAQYNPEVGEVELFKILTVVPDGQQRPEIEISLETPAATLDPEAQIGDELLEKLARSTAASRRRRRSRTLMQRLRDAEREIIYNEFKDRKGELTHSGIVQRFEKKNIIVNLGRTDAILPEKEQIPRERYRQGDRIRAYILDVDMNGKGPQIVLSRTHPGFLVKLFEQEVPEIYEGIVEIKGAAREPGGRAKIAVDSNDRDVDPVGACVGMKGTRVQAWCRSCAARRSTSCTGRTTRPSTSAAPWRPPRSRRSSWTRTRHSMEVIVPTTSSRWRSARRGRTSASPRASPAGSSTSAASPRRRGSAPARASLMTAIPGMAT